MARQFLLMAGIALSLTAFAANEKVNPQPQAIDALKVIGQPSFCTSVIEAERNIGQSAPTAARKAAGTSVHWKRPAGQFWGTGYVPLIGKWYYLTPLAVRPWVDYTFENISTSQGTPTWEYPVLTGISPTGSPVYDVETSNENSITSSYILFENAPAPLLSYEGQVPFPVMFDGADETGHDITVMASESIESYFGATMPVSSHYWSMFTRKAVGKDEIGLTWVSGAETYEGMAKASWFGTNNSGINAMATRFEKPERPYLLNGVQWYYFSNGPIEKEVPLTAYVFKTENDAAIRTTQSGVELETLEIGDAIAVATGVVPVSSEMQEGVVDFKFVERNPVTGAESEISLEIEDDITIIVTGFDVNLGNGTLISSLISNDDIDEGYGNLGFLGSLDLDDESFSYSLIAIKDFFSGVSFGNTTLGVLADVSYPWLVNMYDEPNEVKLPNEGTTTEEVQGLEYYLYMMSTSETSDFEITFNGEDECDWLQVVDAYDDYQENQDGEEEFTGKTALAFQAAANPDDVDRTCVVKISIPAASYTIKFYQGSNNNAVEIVGVEGNEVYYDLAGRRVANPEKGIYIKKNGNKAEKVLF